MTDKESLLALRRSSYQSGVDDDVDGVDRAGGSSSSSSSSRNARMTRLVNLLLGLGLAIGIGTWGRARVGPPAAPSGLSCPAPPSYSVPSEVMELKGSSAVENARNGAVATDNAVCSQVGLSVLRRGGNAADAAVAAALCLGVVNPSSSGIGGGCMVLVHSDAARPARRDDDDGGFAPAFEDARARGPATTAEGDGGPAASRGGRKVSEVIDCREMAPRNSTYDMYEAPESSQLGGLAAAVPGELRGLELLHHRHGSLPWSELVRPAMELARDGFKVSPYVAKVIPEMEGFIGSMPALGRMLTKDNDGVTLLREGDLMVQSQLARTLEAVMRDGADALYRGDSARMLAKDIQDAGGIITSADISNYRPVLRDPLVSRVAGYTVMGAPPPSSGGAAVIGALRFLAGFSRPYSALKDTLSKHWYVEACKHVFAIRMSLCDPKFAPEENADAVNDLINGEYMETLRHMTLDDTVLNLSQYGGQKWAQLKDDDGGGKLVDAQEGDRRRRRTERTSDSHRAASRNLRLFNYLNDHGTSSLTVVDKHRNTVTLTTTINRHFGSKVVSPSTGILLNNQMDDFSSPSLASSFGLIPSKANYPAPGKRPLSSMSPTMVFRDDRRDGATETDPGLGRLVLSVGASGGPKIITAVTQTILNFAFVGMPLYESVSSPRIHNQLLYHGAAATNIGEEALSQGPEVSLSERTRAALKKRGHELIPTNYAGTVQAVAVDLETDLLTAVSDIRKQGMPAAY